MVNLFGIDIPKIIGDAFAGQLVPLQLIQVTPATRTSGSLTAGLNPTTRTVSGEGVLENYQERTINGTRILQNNRRVLIIANSLPSGTVPEPNDKIKIEGSTFVIIDGGVSRDPAGATYSCQVRQ